jgi:hypothetical protein
MVIALAIIICLDSVICFIIGAKVGQKVVRQEPIEINPIKAVNKAIEEHKEALIKDAEEEYYKAVYSNIDNYTGDSIGQVDIPRRK